MAVNDTSSVVNPIREWTGTLWLIAAAGAGVAAGLLATRVSTPVLVLIAAIGLLGAAAVLKLPELGLVALAFSTYTNLSDVLVGQVGARLTLMKLLVPLLVLAVLAQWYWRGHRPEGWYLPAMLVAAYGLAGILSLPAATDPGVTLDGLATLAKDGIVGALVVILIREGVTLRRVLWALLAAGILMGTISVHQYLTGNFGSDYFGLALQPVRWSASGEAVHRVAGPIGNPNSYGMVLLVLIPIAIDRLTCGGKLAPRLLALWGLAVCSMSIVFTFSRGAFVGLVAMLTFLLIIRRPRPRYLLAAIAVVALLSPLVPSTYIERLGSLTAAMTRPGETISFQDSALRGRLSENLAAVRMFLDHPLTGVGLGNYPMRYQEYSQQIMLDPRATQRSAHNLYLEIASETGILGLLAFGTILWVLFHRIMVARRSLRDPRLADIRGMVDAVAIGLIGYLAGSLFLHGAHMRYFWLLAGIALALPRVAAAEQAVLHLASDYDSPSPRDDS